MATCRPALTDAAAGDGAVAVGDGRLNAVACAVVAVVGCIVGVVFEVAERSAEKFATADGAVDVAC